METLKAHLSFELDGELYAVNAGKVMSILEMVKLTKIPNSPSYLAGVINLRGKVLPVINTRAKLSLPTEGLTSASAIIVVTVSIHNENVSLGMVVDNVHSVFEIETGQVLPTPSIGNSYRADYITGIVELENQEGSMVTSNKKLVMLLDIDKVFENTKVELTQNHEIEI